MKGKVEDVKIRFVVARFFLRPLPPSSLSPRIDSKNSTPRRRITTQAPIPTKGRFSFNQNFNSRSPRRLVALLSRSAWSSHPSYRLLTPPRRLRPLRLVATSDDCRLILSTLLALLSPTSPSSTPLLSKRTIIISPPRTRRILRKVPASKHHRRRRFVLDPYLPLLSMISSLVSWITYCAMDAPTDNGKLRQQHEIKVPWLRFRSTLPALTPSRRMSPIRIVEQATAASISSSSLAKSFM